MTQVSTPNAVPQEVWRGKAYPLGTDEDYSSDLDAAIGNLNSGRSSGVSKLKSAKTGGGQAKAAASIAGAYATTATGLRNADVSPQFAGANDSLVSALKDTQRAYRRLSSAAKSGSSSGYNKARRQISRGEAAVERALGALKKD